MTPPPSEPIRPIGPLDGGTYVGRLTSIDRVGRRRQRGDADERDGHQPHREPDAPLGEQPAETPICDLRAYDDHGRIPDDDDGQEHPHINATA